MKKVEIKPENARVKGNLIPDWDDLLSRSNFEDFHVSREKSSNINWQGLNKKTVRLNARAEPVTMSITQENQRILPEEETSIITVELTYKEQTGSETFEIEPVPYQPIYIYDNNELISTGATDANGLMTYEYSSINSGRHEIMFMSPHMNGFDTSSKTVVVYVLFVTSLSIDPWYSYELPFGTVKQLKATLLDNYNNPVPDKPIVFYEGYRSLGTVKTDNEGNARVSYLESDNRGTATKIRLVDNPTFYEEVSSVIRGVLSTVNGTALGNKNVALFHEYSGHMLGFGSTDNNGNFSIVYNPEVIDIPTHFYVAFRSRIENSTDNEYTVYEPTFIELGEKVTSERPDYMEDITGEIILRSDEGNNHWYISRGYSNDDNMSSATSHAPSVVAGNYDCGINTNLYQSLPYGENWIIRLTCEITGDTSIVYNNVVDGSLTLSNGNNGFKIYDNTHNYENGTTVSSFTDNNVTVNTLYIIREGNKITFNYTSATGELVTYNRDYTSLSVVGSLYIRVANGSCILNELQMIETEELTNNIALPTYNIDNWAFISRGDGSTEQVFNDDGTISCGKYIIHTWKQAIQTNKIYNMYIYKSSIYGYMNAGISNNNTTLPTGISSVIVNQSNGAVAGINKITIYYDTTTQKWYLQYNDDSSTIKELTNNNVPRYLIISTQSTVNEEQKILAITEEEVNTDG